MVGYDRDRVARPHSRRKAHRRRRRSPPRRGGRDAAQGSRRCRQEPGGPGGDAAGRRRARARDIPVWSEIELGARLLANPLVGVTGTNGKTTTTALLGEIFRAAATRVEVAGNIGRPLTSLVGQVDGDAWVICELSSFQLEDVESLRARVAVLLNLEPDHLDRHADFDAYRDAKLRIFERQTEDDVAVVPRGLRARSRRGARIEFSVDDALPGELAPPAARTTARTPQLRRPRRAPPDRGRRDRARAASFAGVEHRIEEVGVARRRPLRQRLEGHECRGGAAGGRIVRRSAARDSRRARQARELSSHSLRRSRADDRAYLIGAATDEIAAALDAAGCATCARAISRARSPQPRGRPARRRRAALAGLCQLRPVRELRAARRAFRALVAGLERVGGDRTRGRCRHDARPHRARLLVLVTLALVAFGLVMVFSATSASAALGNGDPMTVPRQAVALRGRGSRLLAVMSRFDYHRLRPLAPLCSCPRSALCLAVLVLAPPSTARGAGSSSARSACSRPSSRSSRSASGSARGSRGDPRRARSGELLKPIGIVTALFCGAIILEPDLGTTIAMALMVGGVLLVSGVPTRLFLFASTLALGLGAAAIWAEPYRRARFFSFLHPTARSAGRRVPDPPGDDRRRLRTDPGRGAGHGVAVVFYLPEAHTDMIAAADRRGARPDRLTARHRGVRGVRLGRFPCRAPLPRPVRQAARGGCHRPRLRPGRRQPRGRARFAPLTGIPLPFVSYGGSSLIVLLTAVGVLLNIAVNERVVEARVRDRGRGDRRARSAGARRRGGASRARGDGDVRRDTGSRRVAAGS